MQVLPNHVILQPAAGQPTVDTSDLPQDLQMPCADWPVYEVKRREEAPGEPTGDIQEDEDRATEQVDMWAREGQSKVMAKVDETIYVCKLESL